MKADEPAMSPEAMEVEIVYLRHTVEELRQALLMIMPGPFQYEFADHLRQIDQAYKFNRDSLGESA